MATCTFHRFAEPVPYHWGLGEGHRPAGEPTWKFELVTQDGPMEPGYTSPGYRLHAVAYAPKRPPQSLRDVWLAHPELGDFYEMLRAETPDLLIQRI
jgi:hypothetical protein